MLTCVCEMEKKGIWMPGFNTRPRWDVALLPNMM